MSEKFKSAPTGLLFENLQLGTAPLGVGLECHLGQSEPCLALNSVVTRFSGGSDDGLQLLYGFR